MKINCIFFLILTVTFLVQSTSGIATNWEHQIISFSKVSYLTEGDRSNVVIAIVDSGIDSSHTEFHSDLLWENPNEIPGNNIDDDENGYIDDIHGWDFVENDNNPKPVEKNVDTNNNGRIDEDINHGTLIAGIISSQGKNMNRGIVPRIQLIDLRVFDTDGVIINSVHLLLALEYIYNLTLKGIPVKLINYSISHDFFESEEFNTLIYKLKEQQVILVGIAGNDRTSNRNKVEYPANHADVIGVGAVDSEMELADFSRYGENLSLVAPGKEIYSTVLDNKYFTGSGTSFAVPFVVGALAFLWSLKSDYTRDEMISTLLSSTTDLGEKGKDIYFGYGLLNVTKLLITAGIAISKSESVNLGMAPFFFTCLLMVIKKRNKLNIHKITQ